MKPEETTKPVDTSVEQETKVDQPQKANNTVGVVVLIILSIVGTAVCTMVETNSSSDKGQFYEEHMRRMEYDPEYRHRMDSLFQTNTLETKISLSEENGE